MRDFPKIVSVDDHVVEPPDVWQRAPRPSTARRAPVVRSGVVARCRTRAACTRSARPVGDGPATSGSTRTSAIPTDAERGGGTAGPRDVDGLPITYDDIRPGCYDPTARLADMDLNHIEASLCFPTYPRFCGQRFAEAKDHDLGARLRPRLQRLDGRGVGRRVRRPAHPVVHRVPLWDADAGRRRGAPQRRPRGPGGGFSELPSRSACPSIHDRSYWDPFFAACAETGTVISCTSGRRRDGLDVVPTRRRRCRHALFTQHRVPVARPTGSSPACSSASRISDRLRRGPDRLDPVHPRARRRLWRENRGTGLRASHRAAERVLPDQRLRVLLRRRPRARCARRDRLRPSRLRDRLPAPGQHLAPHTQDRGGHGPGAWTPRLSARSCGATRSGSTTSARVVSKRAGGRAGRQRAPTSSTRPTSARSGAAP